MKTFHSKFHSPTDTILDVLLAFIPVAMVVGVTVVLVEAWWASHFVSACQ